jgi:hypothetical protein
MTVGKQMLGSLRSLCSVTGADKWLLSRSCEEKLLEAFKRLTPQKAADSRDFLGE